MTHKLNPNEANLKADKQVARRRAWDKENLTTLSCRVSKEIGQQFTDLAITLSSTRNEMLSGFVTDICHAFPDLSDNDLDRCVRGEIKRQMVIALVEPELREAFETELNRRNQNRNEILNTLIRRYVSECRGR